LVRTLAPEAIWAEAGSFGAARRHPQLPHRRPPGDRGELGRSSGPAGPAHWQRPGTQVTRDAGARTRKTGTRQPASPQGGRPARLWRRTRNTLAAACSCAAGGSAGYALSGPAFAAAGCVAVVLVAAAVAIILSAMLGHRDLRQSPFERLMLLICVITGRRPRDYLPPPAAQKRPAAGPEPAGLAAVTVEPRRGGVDIPRPRPDSGVGWLAGPSLAAFRTRSGSG
jgi:hypothetical protein